MHGAETIRVPATLNAGTVREFAAAFACAVAGDSRVLVLEGSDGVFCRGLDLEAIGDGEPRRGVASFAECLHAIREAGKPVIAAVDGPAIGGGVGIAAACDLVIVSARATFGMPELLFGLVPAIVLPILLERLSPQKVRLAVMLARTFTATEAVAFGLADVLAPDLDKTVRGYVRRLSRAQPDAVRALKRFTAASTPLDEAGLRLTAETLSDPAVATTIRQFLAGEAVPWLKP